MLDKAYQSSERINSNTNNTGDTSGGANDTNAGYEDPQEISRRRILRYLLASILVIFALISVFMFVQYAQPNAQPEATQQYILVPDIVGQSQDEAIRLLKVLGIEYDIEYVTDEQCCRYCIDQSPVPNLKVDNSIKMTLTISKGPELYSVPDVSNMYFTEAIEAIENAGFVVGNISREISTDAKDYVTRQSPKTDSQIPLGEEIDIWLSAESDIGNIMPNVVGQSYQNALYLLSSLDNRTESIDTEEVSSGYDKGIVINQIPMMDTELYEGQDIKLFISDGEGENYVVEKEVLVSCHKEQNHIVVIFIDNGISQVVYDQILTKGDHQLPLLNLTSNTPGEKELTIFCDGEEIGRDRVVFEVSE